MKKAFNSISANFTKWSNTLKQFVGKLLTICLSVFEHFVGLALNGLRLVFFSIFKGLSFRYIKQILGEGERPTFKVAINFDEPHFVWLNNN